MKGELSAATAISPATKERLTDATIRRLPVPPKGNRVFYDTEVPGFGLRVTASGFRSFVLNFRTRAGRERRFTIGRYPDWTTTAARAEAMRLRRAIDEGSSDPLAQIRDERAAPSMGDLIDRFEAEHLPRKRQSTAVDYRRIIKNHIRPALLHLKVADVTFSDADRLQRKITVAGHHYRANCALAVLSKMFSLAIKWEMRTTNPCGSVERNVEYGRQRYLSGDELGRLVQALAEHSDRQAANIIRLLLLTGCRKSEALTMQWSHVDLERGVWSKPASTVKQKRNHEAPLSAPARQLLTEIRDSQSRSIHSFGDFVFPGRNPVAHRASIKRNWNKITTAAEIEGLRIHDLRHSFASQLVNGGASLPLIGALLGHANPSTTARYAHLMDDPQRAAVEQLGATIVAVSGNAPESLKWQTKNRK